MAGTFLNLMEVVVKTAMVTLMTAGSQYRGTSSRHVMEGFSGVA